MRRWSETFCCPLCGRFSYPGQDLRVMEHLVHYECFGYWQGEGDVGTWITPRRNK